ncbi:tetratricopeptide repeat protein [Pseudochryseolinea flava]|nr:tetratricopeptide repeat protein [Pseudochryseolinea flava]
MFSVNVALACLNGETLMLKDGFFVYEDYQGRVPHGHNYAFDTTALARELSALDSMYRLNKDLDYLSDKGLVLILMGKYDEAIQLYLKIEAMSPGRYSTASNIGTAYELYGNNVDALKWIRRAVQIDEASHDGSEWIHIKILEAKVDNVQRYASSLLLNTDFGSSASPVSNKSEKELNALANQLFYQLNERVSFVDAPDSLIAGLLFDLGNIEFILGNYENAEDDYVQAQRYGMNKRLLNIRLGKLRGVLMAPARTIDNNVLHWREVAVGILASGALVFTIFKIRRRRRTKS